MGKSIIKSTAYRLNTLVSKDEVLEERKAEYSRYFYASLYKPKMDTEVMDEITGLSKDVNNTMVKGNNRLNRGELKNRPKKDKTKPGKKVFSGNHVGSQVTQHRGNSER